MTPKRGDLVAPPAVGDEYAVRHAANDAIKGWQDLCTQEPSNARWAYEQMRDNPGCRSQPPSSRHFRLHRDLSSGVHAGRELPQWQLEVLGGGRIWYLLDDERRTCWIKLAGRGHPKQTE